MVKPVDAAAVSTEWDPLVGRKLGPAWLAACEYLKTGEWYYTYDLYVIMAEAVDLPFDRVTSRLKGALRYGMIERAKADGRHVVRVTEHGRKTRPELRA